MNAQRRRAAGFTLLPVILVMTLIAGVAYLLNRDNGMNAAMVASQGDRDRARYAAEAGLQAVNADIQTRNCTGLYPSILSQKINSNFGGASYSAYAVVPWGNAVSLVATGTYNGTSVTLTRDNVIAYQLAPQSYTLQPNAAGGIDTYIEINKTWNDGKGAVLWAGSNYDIPMLKFDLSMFPAGSLPLAATLSLFQLSGSNGSGTKSIHRMTANWVEGTGTMNPKDGATWFTSDGSALWTFASIYHPAALASVPYIAGSSFWEAYDVTDLAAAWMTGRYPNFGVLLMMSPAAGTIKYASSDANTAATWPKIDFNYLLPCGTTGPTNTPPPPTALTLTPVADATIDVSAGKTSGTDVIITAGKDAGSKPGQAFVRFDTSSIPPGKTISAAKLRLYLSSTFGNGTCDYGVYRVTGSWTESTISLPVAYDTSAALATLRIAHGATSVWYEWPIPSTLIQEWVDGVSPNYGLLVNFDSNQNNRKASFSSREGSDPAQLVITY